MFAEIALVDKSSRLDKCFSYLVPDGMDVKVGMRVLVPFGAMRRDGIVVSLGESCDIDSPREIIKIKDETPLITEELIALAKWMQRQYFCTFSKAVSTIAPSGLSDKTSKYVMLTDSGFKPTGEKQKAVIERLKDMDGYAPFKAFSDISNFPQVVKRLESIGAVIVTEKRVSGVSTKKVKTVKIGETADYTDLVKRSPKQAKVMEILRQTGEITLSDLIVFADCSYQTVNALFKKGIVEFGFTEVKRDGIVSDVPKTEALPPTDEQKEAIDEIIKSADNGDTTPILLRGVTGSGKTEVFLQVIEHIIKKGMQAIVLVPEISLTPQTVARFSGRFPNRVSVLHSGLSAPERYDEWKKIISGEVDVAIGARSAVFAPFSRLGIIIIDEEHEGTYKSENVPCYHAADVARYRANSCGATLVLGSATPSVSSYCRAKSGKYKLLTMENRYNKASLPEVFITDMREELERGNRSVFGEKLLTELEKNIKLGQQTILFHNRRGFNSFVLCRSCGKALTCKNCSLTLTYHKNSDRLKCHSCGFECDNVKVCPECRSPHIRFMGTGTEKIEQEIEERFGRGTYIRMDGDTTAGKNSHELILKRFEKENIPILLGTQMVTKGLDFKNVTLVGVMAADLSLNSDDYRAAERTFSQLMQVSGRAGRGDISGRAVIQTYQPEHYCLRLAATHDYPEFYENEIALRKKLVYPPFCSIVMVLVKGADEKKVKRDIAEASKILKAHGVAHLGPVPAPYYRINGKYRQRILIKTKSVKDIYESLKKISEIKTDNNVIIDINPNSMN